MLPYPTRSDHFGNGFLTFYPPHNVFHPGMDFNWGDSPNADLGQDVLVPAWGDVVYVSPNGTNGGLGQYVVVFHPQHGVWTRYLHLDGVNVQAGDRVRQYQVIGSLGNSGTISAHLHFEVLNQHGFEYIQSGDRPFGKYPSGTSKQFVAQRWIDPLAFLRNTTDTEFPVDPATKLTQLQKALKWATGLRRAVILRAIERLQRLLGRVS